MDEVPVRVSGRRIEVDAQFNRNADSMLAEAYRRLLASIASKDREQPGATTVQIPAEFLLPAKEEAA
jgi:hypothetical protein